MRDIFKTLSGKELTHSFLKEIVIGLLIAGLLGLVHACRRALREAKGDGASVNSNAHSKRKKT